MEKTAEPQVNDIQDETEKNKNNEDNKLIKLLYKVLGYNNLKIGKSLHVLRHNLLHFGIFIILWIQNVLLKLRNKFIIG